MRWAGADAASAWRFDLTRKSQGGVSKSKEQRDF